MLGMKVDTFNRMLVACAICALAAGGMSIPTNAQEQEQDQQDKQKQEKQKKDKPQKERQPAKPEQQQQRAEQRQQQAAQEKERAKQQEQQAAQQQQRAQREQQQQAAQQQRRAQREQQQQAAQQQQRVQREQQQQAAQQLQEQRLSQQHRQLNTLQQQRLVQYRQQVQVQDRLWVQRSALLQQQRRTAQYRFQQAYIERRRQQILDQNALSYDYNSDPNFYSAADYRYSRGGRYYQTNQYGANLLRQAVSYGYEEGFQAGQADREDRWRSANYQNSYAYQDANYGYNGYYVTQSEYSYYFREGFRRGYEDGLNSRSQYGSYSNGNYSILSAVLSQILNLAHF